MKRSRQREEINSPDMKYTSGKPTGRPSQINVSIKKPQERGEKRGIVPLFGGKVEK